MIIKKILVPYDGSPLSKKALDLAKDLARNFNSELKLLMVIPVYYPISDPIFSAATVTNYQAIVKTLKAKGEKEIRKVTEVSREQGVKASYKMVYDDVSNAILVEAKRSGTSLIVMGSRRMTGLSSIKRLGSTARYVSEHAKCPVTIVH